ncbi:UDP-glucose/GDP-mannose dehydrogenase family protein [Actinomyces bowdenii]|uniref:UDP-glucose 6-dehydrogenase n=1 Tax=Actinomyces bowdenii TaxID=131109 RepID=A0A3P1V713_9ACTO|nr:UDP-glucose/GDP-mannose dehydrogenase family protein [Actinomyces bowdenii]MBO3723828.1 UDP-glucose/GDP-mannose dehydrogenase family protein [Actinomyces bowdenii]RRD29919.1 UDP-glucose/GDP-mannose dehydrogenase family protein [Actinomyces bowdenii]
MRISVIGCGYLGAVHAASMAELGHQVVGIDVDARRVGLLAQGRAPFFEPALEDLLARNVAAGNLSFSQDVAEIRGAQVHFLAVGTPQSDSGAADMSYVDSAITSMLPHLGHCTAGTEVVVGKSTVPVGTAARLAGLIGPRGAALVWNPEFLREGFAVKDTLHPDRMVYGLPAQPDLADAATRVLDEVYSSIIAAGAPRLLMDYATAELVKTSANAFLATKISFINAMALICDAAGADVARLAEAIGMDERIGRRFLRAGLGFGGGCLPKDIRAFQACASELGVGHALGFLAEVDRINEAMRASVLAQARSHLGGSAGRAAVTILGAAFKPDSDDMRNSPALDLAQEMAGSVGRIVIHDPAAGPILAARQGLPFEVGRTVEEALAGADLVIIATEWGQYRDLDPRWAASLVREPRVIDGRNCLDAEAWKAAGWAYTGIGRR